MAENFKLDEVIGLVKMKKEKPEEYKELLKGIKEVTKDLLRLINEISREEREKSTFPPKSTVDDIYYYDKGNT